MKKTSVCMFLVVVLSTVVICLSGCSLEQPGETVAEGRRRHIRKARIEQQELVQDLDYILLADQPSKLSEMRIP